MSTDPYHAVQQEVQSSLQTASTLQASYLRIRNMATRDDSEELIWARNELKATLAALEADLEDMEESVKIVETTGARLFGLDDTEVIQRRKYVDHVRREIENMRADVDGGSRTAAASRSTSRTSKGGAVRPSSPAEDMDEQASWAREEQQTMIRQQDSTIESISGTLTTLAQQAGLMGQEISEHTEMLDDLESGVDRSQGKLQTSMRRLQKFVRDTEDTKSGWCIAILIAVLLGLLLAVILI